MEKKKFEILLVDNDEMSLKSLNAFLESEGYTVASYSNPKEAYASFDKHHYQFVLTDNSMPEMSGIKLIELIKKNDPDICTILYTGYATNSIDRQKNFKYVNYFIQKPLRIRQLISILNNSFIKNKKEKK